MGGLVSVTSENSNKTIKAGDLIIIRGAERLQEGQSVAIKNNNDELVSHNSSIQSQAPEKKGKQE